MALPDLIVNISANADALTSGLSAAQGQIAGFGSKAIASFQGISAVATSTATKLTAALSPIQEAAASGVFGQMGTDAAQAFSNFNTAIVTASQSATTLRTIMAGGIFGIITAVASAGVWFYRLQERAGGVSNAVGLLWDVAKEVFNRIKMAVEGLGAVFESFSASIQRVFVMMFSFVAQKFAQFINPMIRMINNVRERLGFRDKITEIGAATKQFTDQLETDLAGRAVKAADTAKAAFAGMAKPLESWRKIQELMTDKPDLTTPEAPEAPGTTATTPGATTPGRDELRERYLRLQKHLMSREELLTQQYERDLALLEVYHEREGTLEEKRVADRLALQERYTTAINAIREKERKASFTAIIGGAEEIFSALGVRNKKLLRMAKIFGAANALVSTMQGAAKALSDPNLPFPANIAAAAAVVAKGIGFVNAIKGTSESGATGGGGGGGGGVGRGSAAAPAVTQEGQRSTAAVINLSGGDMFSRDQVVSLINSINEAMEDGARLRIA